MTDKQEVLYLKKTIVNQKKIIKLLTKLYDSVETAFVEQRKGNNDAWQNVQNAMDKIDDETDLSEFR